MKRQMGLKDTLAALVLVLYFAELVFPMITTLLPSAIVCLGCFILWLFFVTTIDTKFLLWKKNFVLLVIYFYLILYPIVFGISTIANRYTAMSLVLCGSIIFRYYYAYNKLYILKKVLTITLILSLITMLITYEQLLINPYISRSIKSSGEHSAMLARRGIGGYTFVYYMTALSIPVLYYGLKAEHKKKRIIAIAWYVFSILFIIKSNYLTALLATIVPSAILILLNSSSKKKSGFALGLILGIILVVIISYLDSILTSIADFLPSRIARVLISGSGGSVMDSILQEFLLDRWPRILDSINSFMEHPFLGLVGSGALRLDGEFLTGFGQHSFIADTFSLYGLFGGIIGTYAAVCPLKRSDIWKNNSPLRIAMIVCVVMIYFFNNATDSVAIVVTIVAPFCVCILNFDEV